MENKLKKSADFLCNYASAFLCNGAHTERVVENVANIAKTWGLGAHLSVFISHITLNIYDENNPENRRTQVKTNTPFGVNLALLVKLNRLSENIQKQHFNSNEAQFFLNQILRLPKPPFWANLLFLSLANMAFCRLFGGDLGALFCIFLATSCGICLRHFFIFKKIDTRIQYFLCAFLVSFLAYLGIYFNITQTASIAIIGSILYLIPGVLIFNVFVDILYEHTLMAIARAVHMLVLMTALAAGVFMTMSFFAF